jgi:hypothetical protein
VTLDNIELVFPELAPEQTNQSGNQDNGRKRYLEEEDRDESEGGNAPHDSILQRLAANANHGHRHDGHDCRLKTVKDRGYPGEVAIGGVNEAQCPKDKDRWDDKESAGDNPTQGLM